MQGLFRILISGLSIGLAGLLFGVVGPMLLAPGFTDGPLIGLYGTGPLGLVIGLVVGWRLERQRDRDG